MRSPTLRQSLPLALDQPSPWACFGVRLPWLAAPEAARET
jgi:hypothetical protein